MLQQPLVTIHWHLCLDPAAARISAKALAAGGGTLLEITSWPSSPTPHPKTTASIGGFTTKLGKSEHRLPTEDVCRFSATLLVFLLGLLLDAFEVLPDDGSDILRSEACTMCFNTAQARYDYGGMITMQQKSGAPMVQQAVQ